MKNKGKFVTIKSAVKTRISKFMTNQEETNSESEQLKKKIEEIEQELEECEEEKEEYLSGWKRARASLLNYKKEEQERLEEAKNKGKKELILKILSVLDSFDRAEKNSEEGLEEGVRQIKKELQSILAQEGVERIDTDQEFDPALHEAVEQLPSDEEEGTIVEEVTAGYKFQGKVIRAAEVKVAADQDIN